jgi:GrpB-like predicted nucleotidyltransferase (UPF0157 family)
MNQMQSIEKTHNSASVNDEYLQKVTVGELKPYNSPITLMEYDPHWPELFERKANRIWSILGSRVLQLEHVGSTSIPGLCAKSIIDILLVVEDSSDEPSYVPALETAGYMLRIREPDWFEHRMFKGPDTDINLHVFSAGASEVKRMLRFRDWLRTNDIDRENYERVKRDLAQHVWKNVQNYADAKNEIVEEIMERANSAKQ